MLKGILATLCLSLVAFMLPSGCPEARHRLARHEPLAAVRRSLWMCAHSLSLNPLLTAT